MTDRLAELKAEVARLNAKIAALEGGGQPETVPPAEMPPERRGFEVREIITERNDLPSFAEMKKLLAIVRLHVPHADRINPDDPDQLLRGFVICFRRIANLGRCPTPNGRYGITWWMDECKSWLRTRGVIANDVSGAAYIAAVLASGDVPFVRHDAALGHVWEFGLLPYGGKPAGDAWKRVLETGNILPGSHPARSAPASHQPVRQIGW